MPFFVESRLYEPLLPSRFLGLLGHLDQFDRLRRELQDDPPLSGGGDERVLSLHAQHERLLRYGKELLPPGTDLVGERAAVKGFANGMLLLSHYGQTVAGELPIVDTIGSKTLSSFHLDVATAPDAREALRAALVEAFHLRPDELAEIDAQLELELQELRERQSIMRALDELYPMEPGELDAARKSAYELFDGLVPDHALWPGELDVIRTGTGLLFFVPYTGEVLDTPGFARRTPQEQERAAEFVNRLKGLRQRNFANFPVFGPFRGEWVRPALVDALCERTGLDRDAVLRSLTTMVAILRSAEVDQYIVHDVWGHQWQSHLMQFEHAFRELAGYEELPALEHTFRLESGERSSLADALDAGVARIAAGEEPDPGAWDRCVKAVVSERLVGSMSGLVAELLADVTEYKLVASQPVAAAEMDSSSFFKELPTKLDLTLQDLRLFFRFCLEGFHRFADSERCRTDLARRYAELRPDVDPGVAIRVVDSFHQRSELLLDGFLAPGFLYEPTPDGIRVNAFTRVALNLLGLHTALLDCYQSLARDPVEFHPPVGDFRDPLVFTTAAFFQQNPLEHFWHLDEFLEHHFAPCLRRLLEALR